MKHVASLLVNTAEKILPTVKPRGKAKVRDDILSRLCAQSRTAWRALKEAGSPREGIVYEEKCRLR